MFCSRSLNNSVNHIHELVLRLIHDDCMQLFEDILEIANKETLHEKLLECLVWEIYKFCHGYLYLFSK